MDVVPIVHLLCVAGLVAVGEERGPGGLSQGGEERRFHAFVERERFGETLVGFVVAVEHVREYAEIMSDARRGE